MIYSDSVIKHCEILATSFYTLTGKKLVNANEKGQGIAKAIYNAPFVVVSHGVEPDLFLISPI
jgi:hypothetical protein